MRSVITGARGFCGRHLAAGLRAQGHSVFGIDIAAGATPAWLDESATVDVGDAQGVRAALRQFRPATVFHLAGAANGDVEALYHANVAGTVNLLEAIRDEAAGAGVVVVGSAAEYGHVPASDMPVVETRDCQPVSPYGISKHAATAQALDVASRWGLNVVVARPFNIVGAGVPADLVVGALVARIRRAAAPGADRTVPIGNLNARRDFVAVEDVVRAYLVMAQGGGWGEVFNVCSGQPRSIQEVADALCAFAPEPVRLRVDPALIRPEEVPIMVGSGKKARDRFGFEPRFTLKDALLAAWRGWGQS